MNLEKNGVRSQCILCTKHYHSDNKEKRNLRDRNRRKRFINFNLFCSIRSRTCQAIKSQYVRKLKEIFDFLGCSRSFFFKDRLFINLMLKWKYKIMVQFGKLIISIH